MLNTLEFISYFIQTSGVARALQTPRSRGGRGAEGLARGPPGRSGRRNPLARGPNKLFAGGPENRRYATDSDSSVYRFRLFSLLNLCSIWKMKNFQYFLIIQLTNLLILPSLFFIFYNEILI